ncbi:MAG TPA: LysR family transcriptional regulator [Paraburkholderia sp.]|jgi:LysR family transcriptional regulator for bpeEF and oprC|nr:LysR family transcriptional regulator [Paraburkholderia sp.]
MDKLQAMTLFVRVVEAQSFSKAAETLSMPRSSVTTAIKHLEQQLGAVLLRRSTRTLSLTEAGERYYASCRAILADIAHAESELVANASMPRGRVRADMPGALGRAVVLPRLQEFDERYPEIELILGMSDRPLDLIYDGVDCAIRSGELADSALVARPLGRLNWVTCASPLYLKRYGEPADLLELGRHRVINYVSNASGRPFEWRFIEDGQPVSLALPGRLAINETDAYLQCGLEGMGLIQLSEFVAWPYLKTGRLREVLSERRAAPVQVSIVYPDGKHASAAVRSFIDWIVEIFAEDERMRL